MSEPIDMLDIAARRLGATSERMRMAMVMQAGPAADSYYARALADYDLARRDLSAVYQLIGELS